MSIDIFSYLKRNAPEKFSFLDIGSKKGKWLVPFVDNFHNTEFYCFEALPDVFEGLKNRYKNYPNVKCYNFVISEKNNETVFFYRDINRPGWSGMAKHEYMDLFEEIQIESRTIDSFNLDPYFIKLDVEGAELLALKGSKETLKRVKVLWFECNEVHYKNYGYSSEDLFLFLSDFEIFNEESKPLTLDEFVFLTADQRRYENPKGYGGNFLAVKK